MSLLDGHETQVNVAMWPLSDDVKATVAVTAFFTGRNSGLRTGYTYGGGVEYALPTDSFLNFFKSSAVTIKVEYLHYDLGHDTFTLASVNGGPGSYTIRSHEWRPGPCRLELQVLARTGVVSRKAI